MKTDNLMTQIVISISEVMETMFYIPVEPREEKFNAINDLSGLFKNSSRIQAAFITFHASFSGLITLIVPENLLEIMTENFMGEDRENLTVEHLEGTLKETLNMVAGNTFSKLDSQNSFGLGVPQIINISAANKISGNMIAVDTMDGAMGIVVSFK